VKIEEVKSKSDTELAYELDKMKKELFELRFKSRTAGNASPARMQVLKRTIARVHTVRNERARQGRETAKTAKPAKPAKSQGRAK